jgi:hypothetical protein
MAITVNPIYTPNSIYRPNVFIAGQASANALVLCRAEVYVDAVLEAVIQKAPYLSFGGSYYFNIDVSKVLRNKNAPLSSNLTTIFGSSTGALNVPVNNVNKDCHSNYFIIVTYFYRDPTTGLLTDLGVTDNSATFEAIIATRQTRDDMDLSQYLMSGAGFTSWLSNRPLDSSAQFNYISICEDENYFHTCIPYTSNCFEVNTYDINGTPIDRGLAAITPPTDSRPVTLGLGVPNLATQTYFDGAVNILDPNMAYYRVRVGFAIFAGTWNFGGRSVLLQFNLDTCCNDRAFRLHYMNRLGGAEAYTFNSRKAIEEVNKSDIAQRPQTWGFVAPPNTIYDKGKFKIQNSNFTQYRLEGTFYDENDAQYIKDLLSSPEVYWETSDGLVAVVVLDAAFTISETETFTKLELTVVEANDNSVQQM